ncbi:MAG: hypothetical protein NC302_08915 [Bacteroidales bacterium]|nr:hypothetical protein [Bacteroidales bacterium]MCM1416327.1 hypothetical protein [bacterium]MCM1423260.1 hypothetical protein [bacterium]
MKQSFWNKKSNLDEMQELNLLKLESRGFWLGFFGLFAAILIQGFLYGRETGGPMMTGEFIVFLCMGIYLAGGCLKNGIWDRHLQPTFAVNIGISLLAAAITALFNAVIAYREYQSLSGAAAVFVIYFFLVGIIVCVTLGLCTVAYRKKRKRLGEEERDE